MQDSSRKYLILAFVAFLLIGLAWAAAEFADHLAKAVKLKKLEKSGQLASRPANLRQKYIYSQLPNRPRPVPAPAVTPAPAPVVSEGSELIGKNATEWTVSDWVNSEPLTLASLQGKVVVVRWWTYPDCPFCAKSAPALNEFWQLYRDKGLVVVGMYHPKADTSFDCALVETQAKQFGFEFPVAIDSDWKTLHSWWLDTAPHRQWTSVTFVLDRAGIIRHVHPGGVFYKGEPSYDALQQKIEELLANPR